MSTIKANRLTESGLETCEGFIGIAEDLCQCDAQYRSVLQSLLGRIVVAQDLDAATQIAKRFHYRFRVVTLDGQVVNAGGSMTGGSQARSAGLLSRSADIAQGKKNCRFGTAGCKSQKKRFRQPYSVQPKQSRQLNMPKCVVSKTGRDCTDTSRV